MPLAIVTKAQFKELSSDLQAEYTPSEDGRYMLDVTDVDGYVLEDVSGLKSALSTERAERAKSDKLVKQFEGIDLKDAKEGMKLKGELGDMSLAEKSEAAVKAREEAMAAKHAEELAKVTGTSEAMRGQLETLMVDNALKTALSEVGGDLQVLPMFLKQRVKVRESTNADGTPSYRAVVLDENGNEAVGDGQGNPMTVPQLVAETSKDTKFARYFDGTGASGSGSSGNPAGNAPKTVGGKMRIPASDHKLMGAHIEDIAAGKAVVYDDSDSYGSDD